MELEFPPGTLVNDVVSKKSYAVPGSVDEELRELVLRARKSMLRDAPVSSPPKPRGFSWVLVLVNLFAALAVLCLCLYFRKRSASRPATNNGSRTDNE